MPTKYYAVKHGKTPGIYTTWDECKRQVHGYPNATYKSFTSLESANDFMNIQTSLVIDDSTSTNSVTASKSFVPATLSDKKAIAYIRMVLSLLLILTNFIFMSALMIQKTLLCETLWEKF